MEPGSLRRCIVPLRTLGKEQACSRSEELQGLGEAAQGRRIIARCSRVIYAPGSSGLGVSHSGAMGQLIRPGYVTPSPLVISRVRALRTRMGLACTQRILGIGRHTVDRVLGGLPVHRATALVVRMALERLETYATKRVIEQRSDFDRSLP